MAPKHYADEGSTCRRPPTSWASGRPAAYELIRCGEWPTPFFRLGKLIRIPTAPLLALLGVEADSAEGRAVEAGRWCPLMPALRTRCARHKAGAGEEAEA